MRAVLTLGVLGLLFGGCSEYEITAPSEIHGTKNPFVPENPVNDDKIVQVTVPRADVLFVVDNSSSMLDEQAQLSDAFPKFLGYFLGSGLDYHIGVVTTDNVNQGEKGKLQEGNGVLWIDDQTPMPESAFAAMVGGLGAGGDSYESGGAAVYRGIELLKDGYNAGFYREEASLHIIIMSDENDWSWEHVPVLDWMVSQQEYVAWLELLKPTPGMVTYSSIVNQAGCCANTGPFSESAGTRYIAVTNAIGGILWDVNSDDWEPVLEQLGMQAAGLSREFFLTQLPVLGTIEVAVETDGILYTFLEGEDWNYVVERNSIVFTEYIPDPLSDVKISYEILAASQE